MSRFTRTLLAAPILAAALFAASACGSVETQPPQSGPTTTPPSAMDTVLFGLGSQDEGERLFGQECAFCHVGSSTGTMMLGRRLGPSGVMSTAPRSARSAEMTATASG